MNESRQLHNIALVGFMGTGKSSVGRLVAALLHFKFIDTDELIEARVGRKIATIFAEAGEPAFRNLEKQIVAELEKTRGAVVSTGGGLAADEANLASLKKHSLVICLWSSPEKIWERVRDQGHRPLLHDPDPLGKIRALLAVREPFYKQADALVNTEMRSIKEVAQQILHQFHIARPPHH